MIDLTVNLYEQGFRSWCGYTVPTGVLLEVVHEGEVESCLLCAEDISPLTNVADLCWRLTGQAREHLGWDWEPESIAGLMQQGSNSLSYLDALGLSHLGQLGISQLGGS